MKKKTIALRDALGFFSSSRKVYEGVARSRPAEEINSPPDFHELLGKRSNMHT